LAVLLASGTSFIKAASLAVPLLLAQLTLSATLHVAMHPDMAHCSHIKAQASHHGSITSVSAEYCVAT
jgi:hypothetical protein